MSDVILCRKKGIQPMTPWTADADMNGVSVSDADKNNGSPKHGDMLAWNPSDKSDRWLIAEKFYKDNYEPIPKNGKTITPQG